ncbi:hypothetical protein BCUN_1811 [Bifidobacterium cuniculi]|uniref:Uncharacterized protein n=1 Tax=Bifidobacterium cuniculi TaxID=1688 RepID=A0A087AT70_9BIFI|nr:hypothetical protein BCUN_1811 [Bifidobacterium cuniculi]
MRLNYTQVSVVQIKFFRLVNEWGLAYYQSSCPAYAGMIQDIDAEVRAKAQLPRVCGDDPNVASSPHLRNEVAPRMRG